MSTIRTLTSRAAGVLAAAVLTLAWTLSASTGQPAPAPQDAVTLVRQALAALETSPPNLEVAAERVIKAQFARDTRGVNIPRVREAQQALEDEDAAAAAAYLMEALRPAEAGPAGLDRTLLVPVAARFVPTPSAYGWLAAAALLIGAGVLIVRS